MAAPATASPGQHHGDPTARQFPLVPRPRTACRPLTERIDRVARLADHAARAADDAPLHAAEAFNLAALIASDCAMPGLARDLCWRQFDVFATAGPCGETTAKFALQPLVNLARLHIRDGDGDAGYQLLESLYDGARASRTQADIGDRPVDLASPIAPGAGHWTAARHQAQRHNGIGQRLLDGRQIAILAHSTSGQHDEAEQILQQTTAAEPWEHAVAACLRAINLTSDNPAAQTTRAAREVLTSPAAAFITRETRTTLRGSVHRADLGNPLTTPQQQQLMNSISSAATTLAAALIPVRT